MWSTVLVMAAVAGADPVRIGIAALLLSRPRPQPLLVGFFVAAFSVNMAIGVVVLFVSRDAGLGAGRGIPPAVELAIGGIALAICLLAASGVLTRLFTRLVPAGRRERQGVPGFTRLPAGVQAALRGETAWAAWLLGLSMAGPTAYSVAALAAVITSGTAMGEQVAALIVFNIIGFAATLIPMVSFWTAPTATRSAVDRLNSAVRTHHRVVVAAIAGVIGLFFLALGFSHLP